MSPLPHRLPSSARSSNTWPVTTAQCGSIIHIRCHSRCTYSARNILRSLELFRTLPQNLLERLQRNSDWAHPEAMLFAMAAHQNPQVRARAVQVIQRYRQQPDGPEVRKYELVNVDFTATELRKLLEHSTSPITRPSLTMDLSNP